ncbi:MAG: dihydroorotate dehydrogenase electron transfer subunit [Treponema sp.]|jgi:NAD(P)H-flavin reductase|nr:dihydroorotate dehydrogenase electron transfer subunit [Treponema sp.]
MKAANSVIGENRPAPRKAPQSLTCELVGNTSINREIFRLDFVWPGPAPGAGQFFMVKPRRSAVFLGRPISAALWMPAAEDDDFVRRKVSGKKSRYQRYLTGKYFNSNTVKFLIARRGRGTEELSDMRPGEEAELTGPLGNAWADFLTAGEKPAALIGGGIGIAPLEALITEWPGGNFDFYAGFKTGFHNMEEKYALVGPAILKANNLIIAAEDGKAGLKGRIPDFLEPEKYRTVCACGPVPMLKVVAARCKAAGVPCFVSLERRMACGVGACLGCSVAAINGNRRCCADGPIFPAEEIIFDE